jgi:RimJ/RimL family protein N-acetyltransferase
VTGRDSIIETPRLRLRPLVEQDAAALASVFEDEAARTFYPDMHRLENALRWIRRNAERYAIDRIGLWAVIDKATGSFAGDAGLMLQPLEDRTEMEVGYHLHAAWRGRGLATEAAAACMARGIATHGFPRIISLVHPENTASHGVAARIHRHVRRAERHGILYFVYFTERPAAGGA